MASETFLTYRKSNEALPVARDGNKTIYISQSNEEEDEEQIMNYARSIDIHKIIDENKHFVQLKPREKDKLRNEIILHLTKHIPPIDDNKREIYDMIVDGVKKGELKTQIVSNNVLQPIPSDRTGRSVFYVSGGSGSGKSYFMSRLAKQYNIQYPDRSIFLFSFVEHDSNYDDIENLHKIPLTEELLNQQVDWEEFRDSFMLFDDYDSTPNKRLKSFIEFLLSHLLVQGRHLRASIAMTSHTNTDYKRTRLILAESTHIVIFPKTSSRKSLEYLLKSYTSLSREDISQVFKMGKHSRYICIHKSPPSFILTQNSITLI
jgi:hypothetical protein